MSDVRFTASEVERIRERVKYEDGLLIGRTNVIITFNALAAVAVGLGVSGTSKAVIAGTVLLINFLWIWRARDAASYIALLSRRLRSAGDAIPIDEQMRLELFSRRPRIVTVDFFAFVIPWLLFLAWCTAVALEFLLSGTSTAN